MRKVLMATAMVTMLFGPTLPTAAAPNRVRNMRKARLPGTRRRVDQNWQ
jgi:hypothetical protein